MTTVILDRLLYHTSTFNFIQQKSPTSVSGEINAYWYSIQWGFKPRLNKVKASGGCHRFSGEIYRAELDKIRAQIRQSACDYRGGKFSIFPFNDKK
ncbi:hypothetical protein D5F11_025190 [Siminovitchia terrae]|uniref:Uncharacterized protein n=1 Tax=Siminovitchia terrae TaxID=1914933 RepID=A0A429X1A1_SIMTE|nr:hypothetical protein [Siminovitchia terrae]RST56988.1 hypothetical protein D5F11_025190 [Siminovitchia terrae]